LCVRLSGERKTITALFADLKGSTALIEGLDPEEVCISLNSATRFTRRRFMATFGGYL
jgi:class 3 adenylate cyclase